MTTPARAAIRWRRWHRGPALLLAALVAALAAPPSAGQGTPAAAPAAAAAAAGPAASAPAPEGAASAPAFDPSVLEPPAPVSPSGQRVYEAARQRLVQVRTLLKGQDSQSSVGSGFLVADDGHLVTNFHVVSQYALRPERHRLVFATADGRQGGLELIDVDVVHDLALLRPLAADAPLLADRGALAFRPPQSPVSRGERIFSLGNPLDVGFAVTEGAYNGLVERSFVPTVFFGGSLSGGMSGGPALDERGRVMGVNVATRRDGEQVSFLVPGSFAQQLLERSRGKPPLALPAYAQLTRQLTEHQEALTRAFLARPWRSAGHPRYRIPVPQENFLRCWGRSTPGDTRGLEFERSDCTMDTRVFVTAGFSTGHLSVRHEAYDGRRLGPFRFAQRYSASFRNEFFGATGTYLTAPQCAERFVDRDGLALRAVLCLRAHKKLAGLYDLGVLVATLDQATGGVQGRFDARGVSHDNAMKLAAHYIDGFAWTDRRNGSR